MLRCPTGLLLFALVANAQTATPPAQPLLGPGGKGYLFPSCQKLGPYYVNPEDPEPYSSFLIFEPSGSTTPSSLPVVLFLHGYLLNREGYPDGDSPSNYYYWIEHIVRFGYTVVFPAYDDKLIPGQFTGSIVSSWVAAIGLLQSGSPGLIQPTTDAQGLQTVFTGHSMGGYETFAAAQQLTVAPVSGVPPPRAIAAFEPAVSKTGLPTDFSQISPAIRVVMVDGDKDANSIPTAQAIWASIENVIPSANRDFLQLISDSHGAPAQLGNHWYPDTNGFFDDDSGLDDRDFNITWKLSVGIFNCVLAGTDCTYGLGHGSVDQINMGKWSDGTPVTPLVLQDPN